MHEKQKTTKNKTVQQQLKIKQYHEGHLKTHITDLTL